MRSRARSTCCSSTRGATPTRAGSTRCFWLDELRQEGLIAHLGAHQHRHRAPARSRVASGVPIVSNQVCYSLLDRRAAGAMAAYCAAEGIGMLAYGTLRRRIPHRALARARPSPSGRRSRPGRR
ncbi:MAG: aldo/keto reductase [Ignavibacteriales bacterium]|nr:aldo/keto reductase [Ignavibacteriales bacterium]